MPDVATGTPAMVRVDGRRLAKDIATLY